LKIWPPDYTEVFCQRAERLKALVKNPVGARAYYSDKPIEFINHWACTYDPRVIGDNPALMPFILFDRQEEFITFLIACLDEQESGMIEKARDIGATWCCAAFSVWLFIFVEGSSVGWGSRKEQLVDRLGDPDSIFQKIRMIIQNLPRQLQPVGWNEKEHSTYMKILNPENGNSITGEAGSNIGRGGRKSIYFKDESAHYERPEQIEAALGDNTNVQIDISSVNGTATVYYRKRMAGEIWDAAKRIARGITKVFIFDWSDNPLKTQEWYDRRRAKAEREGLLHIFAQEVDRDYTASVEGLLIAAKWVKAAVGLKLEKTGKVISGFDVADEGGDKNALATRKGPVLIGLSSWAMGDTGVSTRKAVTAGQILGMQEFHYDCIGVGAGAKAETNRLKKEGKIKNVEVVPWSASAGVLNPKARIIAGDKESPLNKDFYKNLKSQGSWELRLRFYKTYRFVNYGDEYPETEMISLPKELDELEQLITELSQPTYTTDLSGKLIINKKPEGAKSPNLFDSLVQAYWPANKKRKVLI